MTINPISRMTAAASTPTTPPVTATQAGTTGTTGSTGSTGSSASTSLGSAGLLDRDAFLKLLVAQLKYQDPSKPLDSSELVSQSAQLSVVDKLNDIATQLSNGSAATRLSLGGALVGKEITFPGTDGVLQTALATSVSFDGTSTVVRAGNWDVPLESIKSIAAPAPTVAASTPAASTPAASTPAVPAPAAVSAG